MAGAFFMSFLGWVLSAAVARVVLSSSVALISTGISAGVTAGAVPGRLAFASVGSTGAGAAAPSSAATSFATRSPLSIAIRSESSA